MVDVTNVNVNVSNSVTFSNIFIYIYIYTNNKSITNCLHKKFFFFLLNLIKSFLLNKEQRSNFDCSKNIYTREY